MAATDIGTAKAERNSCSVITSLEKQLSECFALCNKISNEADYLNGPITTTPNSEDEKQAVDSVTSRLHALSEKASRLVSYLQAIVVRLQEF